MKNLTLPELLSVSGGLIPAELVNLPINEIAPKITFSDFLEEVVWVIFSDADADAEIVKKYPWAKDYV